MTSKELVLFSNIVTPPVRGHRAHYPYFGVINGQNGFRPLLYPLLVGGDTMLANSLSHDVSEQYRNLRGQPEILPIGQRTYITKDGIFLLTSP